MTKLTDEQIITGSKLIANFLNDLDEDNYWSYSDKGWLRLGQFHLSWQYLVPIYSELLKLLEKNLRSNIKSYFSIFTEQNNPAGFFLRLIEILTEYKRLKP